MEAQRFFELCNRLRHVAFAHENFAKIIMRLRKFRIQCGCLLEMLSRFGSLAVFKKQIAKIDVGIDVIWINCNVWRYFAIASSGWPCFSRNAP